MTEFGRYFRKTVGIVDAAKVFHSFRREYIRQVAGKVGCKLVVVIIDDCNQLGFIEQLVPVINSLQRVTDPRVYLIVNMVESVADEIQRIPHDKSVAQRLFFVPPIRLVGPRVAEIGALYERLRRLYEEGFAAEAKVLREGPLTMEEHRALAIEAWQHAVETAAIEANYRSAIRFIVDFLRSEPSSPPQPQRRRTSARAQSQRSRAGRNRQKLRSVPK